MSLSPSSAPASDGVHAPAASASPTEADRAAIQSELLRLSTQPSGAVLAFQFLLDCGVAALFAWQFSVPMAALWLLLIAITTGWRAFFKQVLPDPLTPAQLPVELRGHALRIGVHE
ncbi:MAG: hybrid sensor histidine kinase/response regulator, partial [Proteobacteria bacterium]|nr:hybrid sensor histidine kinase/response regulator [Pseudomonadota bacterium]